MLTVIEDLLMCSESKEKILQCVTVKYNIGCWFKAVDLIKDVVFNLLALKQLYKGGDFELSHVF